MRNTYKYNGKVWAELSEEEKSVIKYKIKHCYEKYIKEQSICLARRLTEIEVSFSPHLSNRKGHEINEFITQVIKENKTKVVKN